ncbi:MAG TPA: hypothetical protein VNO70_25495 [Blastocatellia bacterium]|nr:hypothetical protein [Blastocatellia bacterium]
MTSASAGIARARPGRPLSAVPGWVCRDVSNPDLGVVRCGSKRTPGEEPVITHKQATEGCRMRACRTAMTPGQRALMDCRKRPARHMHQDEVNLKFIRA